MLGVLGQTVAAVAKGRVVVVQTDARLQADALDDVAGVEPANLAIGVQLVEVGHAKGKIGVREKLHCLCLGDAQHELRNANGAVGVGAGQLGGVRTLDQKLCKLLSRINGLNVALWSTHNDATGVQVVIESLALAQELGAEDDAAIAHLLAQARRVAYGDGRLDDNPCGGVHRADGADCGLHRTRVEEVAVRVVVRRRRHNGVVHAAIRLGSVYSYVKVEILRTRLRLGQESFNLVILNRGDELPELLDLLGYDVKRVHLIVL